MLARATARCAPTSTSAPGARTSMTKPVFRAEWLIPSSPRRPELQAERGLDTMATPIPRPVPTAAPNQRPIQPAAPQKPRSRLGQVQRGILRVPMRHMFYGPRGVGKSSLGADAPNPLFADIEGGSPRLNVARYPFR